MRNEALIVALQNTLTAQQNDKNILLVLAAGKFAFFSSLSIILMYFIIIRLISSFVFSCSFLCIAHQALRRHSRIIIIINKFFRRFFPIKFCSISHDSDFLSFNYICAHPSQLFSHDDIFIFGSLRVAITPVPPAGES